MIPNAGDAVGNGDSRQAHAARECVMPDAGDAVGNGDARQAATALECESPTLVTLSGMMMLVRLLQPTNATCPDAGDAAPVNNSWNLNRPSGGSRIVSNRHRRIVGIDLVSIQARYCSTRACLKVRSIARSLEVVTFGIRLRTTVFLQFKRSRA